ncbi:MAG: Mrp/NBP35 family ATP-binding protein [Treponema sp.]|nr:Mrp/NBP35 family ATP-binding protein [Treponema sp.]
MACGGNCSSCSSSCEKKDLKETLRKDASVKKVIGVVSGKGGVGKSLVTSLLASKVARDEFRSAILDADITGPSIPKSFGLEKARAESVSEKKEDGTDGGYLLSVKSKKGTQIMSMNFLLPEENSPVIWRGPVIGGAVKQFWTDVMWEDVDFMFVDCPPGTGDVPLTVFQSLPVDGIIVVSSPQQLVRTIVEKAVNMANMMNIPILGLVENMSYIKCPDCNKEIKIFGESKIEETAREFNIPVLAKIPMRPETAAMVDEGRIEELEVPEIEEAVKAVEALIKE